MTRARWSGARLVGAALGLTPRFALSFALGACGNAATPDPAVTTPTSWATVVPEPAPSASSGHSVSASPAVDRCADVAARFRKVMSEAKGTCATDADCGCFQPVVAEAGCGGITDAPTAKRLGALTEEFRSPPAGTAPCSWPHHCGPWACLPRCEAGRCRNAGSGGRLLP